MKKKLFTIAATVIMMVSMAMTAFAGQWQKNDAGWWWQRTDGSYPVGTWKWIDGNGDGTVESYYFDASGYMLTNTTTPDGYTVNENGTWIVNGVVQSRQVHPEIGDEVVDAVMGITTRNTNGAVTDGKSVTQIVLNEELIGMMVDGQMNNLRLNLTEIGQNAFGSDYTTNYKGSSLKIQASSKYNKVLAFTGIASQIFNNIPEQGIEMNAFYDNSSFEDGAVGRSVMATTGPSDRIFGLPTGSYRMAWGDSGERHFEIVVTPGENDTWYIYPNSPTYMN